MTVCDKVLFSLNNLIIIKTDFSVLRKLRKSDHAMIALT